MSHFATGLVSSKKKIVANNFFHCTVFSPGRRRDCLVERGRSLMDPQPHPLLHFLVRMKPTSTNVFIQVAKMWKSQGERSGIYGGCCVFPSQLYEAYASPDWPYGDGRYHAEGWFLPAAFQGVLTLWRIAVPTAIKKRTSLLFFACLHFQFWTNILYTTLTSRAINKQLSGLVSYRADDSIDT